MYVLRFKMILFKYLWILVLKRFDVTHLDLSNQDVSDAAQYSNKVKNIPCLL